MDEQDTMKRTFWYSDSNNVCAFCWKHRLYLTPKQMKRRKCLVYHCDALQRCEDHTFWSKREERKENRKSRKENLEARYREIVAHEVRA